MRKMLAGFTLALASFTAQAAIVSIDPVGQIKTVGQDVIVNISGAAFNGILGGGFDLSYNPAVLSLSASDIHLWLLAPEPAPNGPWDGGFSSPGTLDDTAGTLTDVFFNQFAGVSGSPQIATLTFKAKAKGVSDLTLSPNIFVFADINGLVTVDFAGGQAAVVPEPATWGLLAAGLGLMLLLAGRREGRGR